MEIQEIEKRFKRVGETLRKRDWFRQEKWLVSTHPFPAERPEGVTFQIYKKTWLNEDHRGIHIESFLSLDPEKRKNSYIAFHILHHPKIPGSSLGRNAIARPFVDLVFEEVSSWDGFKFRAGKYGQQPFSKSLDGSSQSFERRLVVEASRLCRNLGGKMDEVIRKTLGS